MKVWCCLCSKTRKSGLLILKLLTILALWACPQESTVLLCFTSRIIYLNGIWRNLASICQTVTRVSDPSDIERRQLEDLLLSYADVFSRSKRDILREFSTIFFWTSGGTPAKQLAPKQTAAAWLIHWSRISQVATNPNQGTQWSVVEMGRQVLRLVPV